MRSLVRILKLIAIASVVSVVGLGVYLIFPPLNAFSAGTATTQHPTSPRDADVCKANTIYVTARTRDIHENEGYEFVVDDNCAGLQKQLVDAVQNDDIGAAGRLIGDGANPQTADWSSLEPRFPLHVAVYDSPEMVKLLVDSGADVNKERCCCAACTSPLTIAIEHNQKETVQLLLEKGADLDYRPSYTDGDGYSPFELAMQRENSEIARLVGDACEKTLTCRIRLRTLTILRAIKG